MNIISIHSINPEAVEVMSIGDTARYLRLFFPELVDEILESFTDYTEADIIQEIVDTLGLDITCVTEHSHVKLLIHGYIYGGIA